MDHQSRKELEDLLLSIFTEAEVRRCVRYLPGGEHIYAELPGAAVSLKDLVHQTVNVLQRHGRLDGTFFNTLVAERPTRRDEIRALAARIPDNVTGGRSYTRHPLGQALPEADAERMSEIKAVTRLVPAIGAPALKNQQKPSAPTADPHVQALDDVLLHKQRLEAAGLPVLEVMDEIRSPGRFGAARELVRSTSFLDTAVRVEALDGPATLAPGSFVSGRVDVAVMTVIDVELGAVLDALAVPDREKDPDDGTVYYRGAIPSQLARRDYGVVVTCVGAAGNPGAAAAARNLITRYRPRAILLMGIAAGVRGKVRIGDVVFSERVLSYEPAALVRRDGVSTSEPRPEIERIPHAILQDLMGYRSDQKRLQERFLRAGGVFPEPPPGKQEEYRQHVATGVHARPGTIASGEKLLRDPSTLITLRSQLHGKVEVGEMEAAGLVEACRQGGVPWLVIRGISDFGDEFKNDRFHAFAARAAAAVLADFLEFGLNLGPAARAQAAALDDRADPRAPGLAAHDPARPRGWAFVFGRPVDRDEDFVGRRHEQDLILQAIEREQPVQILGESLMGKTSLLRWIQRHVLPSRPVVWLDPTRGLSPVTMMRAIAGALAAREQADGLTRPGASNGDAMLALEALDPFVLLIDDADTLARLGKGFDVEFFNAIRSRVQNKKLTWVSASHRNLYDLFKQNGLTSAFLNDARKIWVGPLDEDAAAGLARRASVAPGHGDIVLRQAGGFAYCLQWLGDYLSLRGRSIDQACDAFVTEMEPLFQRWWGSLNGQERQVVKRCAAGEVRVADLDDRTRRTLRAIADRGLLTERQGRFHVDGLAFREFVKNGD